MTGQKAKRKRDGICRIKAPTKVIKEAGTHTLEEYIEKREEIVEEWLGLRPILEICDRETGYEGGYMCDEPWWRQTADQKNLSATLEEISTAEREQRWESVRRGKGGGGREELESDAGILWASVNWDGDR